MITKLKLWRKGYRRVPPDMYWYSAYQLARVSPFEVKIYGRGISDTALAYKSNVVLIATIDHNDMIELDNDEAHHYLKYLARKLRETYEQ